MVPHTSALHSVIKEAEHTSRSFETAKLASAYSYVMLITRTSDLNDFCSEFLRQSEGLCTGQFLSAMRPSVLLGGFDGVN